MGRGDCSVRRWSAAGEDAQDGFCGREWERRDASGGTRPHLLERILSGEDCHVMEIRLVVESAGAEGGRSEGGKLSADSESTLAGIEERVLSCELC